MHSSYLLGVVRRQKVTVSCFEGQASRTSFWTRPFQSERCSLVVNLKTLRICRCSRGEGFALSTAMQPNNLTFSHILCSVGFSTPAQAAFQQALSLAKAHNAQLSLVFAVPLDVGFNWRARERINLLTEFRKMGDAEGLSISASVQQGEPAGIILLHARARKHDAIVIGTHSRTGLERFRFGSVAERVVAGAPCRTLVVRSTDVAKPETTSFSHILCPVNISPPSETALENAVGLLRQGGQKLTVLHVASQKRERHAHMRLQQLLSMSADLRRKIHARLADGPVASSILNVAVELKPDLIVLGMTSPRGMRNWFNSVTERIVRGSSCPVLTIPGEARLSRAA